MSDTSVQSRQPANRLFLLATLIMLLGVFPLLYFALRDTAILARLKSNEQFFALCLLFIVLQAVWLGAGKIAKARSVANKRSTTGLKLLLSAVILIGAVLLVELFYPYPTTVIMNVAHYCVDSKALHHDARQTRANRERNQTHCFAKFDYQDEQYKLFLRGEGEGVAVRHGLLDHFALVESAAK
uniref:hypothetical protein n=1 Tax=Thaumasiovibrio occultus TaxID=1891184 RepID=UPI000B35F0F9|nr:hypothetical protein [Thaumasiovibrio occultus]